MKIIFIGCVKSSYIFLKKILNCPEVKVVGVITKAKNIFNSDFCSLKDIATEYNINCFIEEEYTEVEMVAWCKNLNVDIIYCFGWSSILKKEILNSSRLGVIGYHPAMLPQNRGRHPIIWALALGLNKTASTFFVMDNGADTGDIISQVEVEIDLNDDANTLYDKLLEVGVIQIENFTKEVINNTYTLTPQDNKKATYWRKRNKQDGKIDWRMSAKNIYNLVRALTFPYVGAHFNYEGNEIKVWRVEFSEKDDKYLNLEPGRIIDVDGKSITVKCGSGIIKLLEYEYDGCFKKGAFFYE